ncbi:MAG: YkgJ family cysteine cluster protein [Treponema sp.]|nr:YkgJ family cysteine cluster protein [Treponema sp.]
MEKSFFFASGLKFSCKRCSSCCRYDAGFVFLTEKDLLNLSLALNMDKDRLISLYCRWVTDWKGDEVLSLKEKINKDCILWDNGCTVYKGRPLQCITFPFWESIMSSAESWDITASGCPGMNCGKLYTETEILEAKELRVSEPIISKMGDQL